MSIHIPSNSDIDNIINCIEESQLLIEKIILNINQSIDGLPSQIKNKVIENYNNLISELNNVKKDCEFTITGINMNINAYKETSTEQEASTNLPVNEHSLSLNSSGEIRAADSEFFKGLASNGRGVFNDENNIYTFISNDGTKYEYNTKSGSLRLNGTKSSVVFGIYVPEDASDLSDLNTITFLHGDGKYGVKFNKDQNLVVASVENCPSDTIMIFPQTDTATPKKGFIPFGTDVVSGTKFVKEITSQSETKQNALVGFSSGFNSAYKIGANEGKNTYDTIVGINGYMGDINSNEIAALKDKKLFMYVAKSECSGVPWERRMNSIDTVYNSGLNPKIFTGSSEYMRKATKYGLDVSFIEDEKFYGHGNGCIYAVKNMDVLHCFDNNKA